MTADQIRDFIPKPRVILMGCRAWPVPSREGGGCPICGQGIRQGDDSSYCAVCDSMSPARERQIRRHRHAAEARERSMKAEKEAREDIRKSCKVELSELHRRQIWNGCMGSILRESHKVTNVAKFGRDWLREIGQEPDWNLVVDRQGKVVGRYDEDLTA